MSARVEISTQIAKPSRAPAEFLSLRPANNVDTLRFLLASAVVLSHSFPLGTGSENHEPLRWLTGQLSLGTLSVNFFFTLSGFLITRSWLRRKSALDYLWRRVGRIYPGFIVANLAGALLVTRWALGADAGSAGVHWKTLSAGTLCLGDYWQPGLFQGNAYPEVLNGSLWSIPYEFKCYLGVALLGLVGLLSRRMAMLAMFVAVLVMGFVLTHTDPGGIILGAVLSTPQKWVQLVPYFLAGMAACVFQDRIELGGKWVLSCMLLLILFRFMPDGLSLALPLCGSYLLLYLAFSSRVRLWRLGLHGDFSYGIYLYAYPIQQLVVMKAGGRMHPLVLFAIAWPLSVLAGVLSWHLVEKWFLRRTRRRRSEGEAAAESAG
jgi:peptidoglycan/LPS O-acetylase OafA/YrhL